MLYKEILHLYENTHNTIIISGSLLIMILTNNNIVLKLNKQHFKSL